MQILAAHRFKSPKLVNSGLHYIGVDKESTKIFLMELSSMKMRERENWKRLLRIKDGHDIPMVLFEWGDQEKALLHILLVDDKYREDNHAL